MLTKARKKAQGRFENEFAEISERIGIGVYDERAKKPIRKPGFQFFIFGVILPVLAIWIETSSHILAGVLFDPFPTFWHVLLFSFIPISNFIVFLSVRMNMVPYYAITSLMSGMAMGISVLYSLMFANKFSYIFEHLHQHETTGFVFLSPLLYAPFLALIPLWQAGKTITLLGARQKAFFDGDHLKHFGHMIILIMVLSIEAPSTLTRIHLSQAVSPFAPTYSAKYGCMVTNVVPYQRYDMNAINWLRDWGNREVLLRACYERGGRATDILGSVYENQHPVAVDLARSVYYRVTGQAFNEAAIPGSFRSTLQHSRESAETYKLNRGADDEFDIDTDIAGESVSGVARGLTTSNSTISGTVDADAAIASLDWDCTFDNTSSVPREARAKLLLPPGACVSKACIWLNDEMKEATIQSRSQARATYVNAVYNDKKDPLLVSMAGPDTVLVQCYPVVKGTVTKVQLHIIAPLFIEKDATKAKLVLPVFSEKNFSFKKENKVQVESKNESKKFDTFIEFNRNAKIKTAYCKNHYTDYPGSCVQAVSNKTYSIPDSLTVLVDGSIGMEPHIKDVVAGLKDMPVKKLRLIRVMDSESILLNEFPAEPLRNEGSCNNWQEALKALSESRCRGGQDNSISLARALESSVYKHNHRVKASVLWIHGTQPVCDPNAEETVKSVIRRTYDDSENSLIFDYQVVPGSNQLIQKLDLSESSAKIKPVISTGHPKEDLQSFYTTLRNNNQEDPAAEYAGLSFMSHHEVPAGAKLTSEDLCILKAYDEAMYEFEGAGYRAESPPELCSMYKFVSPISSFVVTEDTPVCKKQAEYKNNKTAVCSITEEPTVTESEEVVSDKVTPQRSCDAPPVMLAPAQEPVSSVAKEKNYSRKAVAGAGGSGSSGGSVGYVSKREMGEVTEYKHVQTKGRHSAVGFTYVRPGDKVTVDGELYTNNSRQRADERDAAKYSSDENRMLQASVDQKQLGKDISNAAPAPSMNLMEGVTQKLDSLSQAACSVNAPLDPRYGQSNESGQLADYSASSQQKTCHSNYFKTGKFKWILPMVIFSGLLGLLAFIGRRRSK